MLNEVALNRAENVNINKSIPRRAGGWCVLYEKGLGNDDVVDKLLWVTFHWFSTTVVQYGVCRPFVAQANRILKARSLERKTRY